MKTCQISLTERGRCGAVKGGVCDIIILMDSSEVLLRQEVRR